MCVCHPSSVAFIWSIGDEMNSHRQRYRTCGVRGTMYRNATSESISRIPKIETKRQQYSAKGAREHCRLWRHTTHTHTAHMKYSSWKVDNWQWRLRVSGSVQPPNEYYVQYLYFTLSIFKCPKYIFCSVCLSVYMTLSLCAVLHCRVLAEMALTSSHYPPDGCFPPSFFVDVTFAVRASRIRETAHFARAQINIKHFE